VVTLVTDKLQLLFTCGIRELHAKANQEACPDYLTRLTTILLQILTTESCTSCFMTPLKCTSSDLAAVFLVADKQKGQAEETVVKRSLL